MAEKNPFDLTTGSTTPGTASTADAGLLSGASTKIASPTTAQNVAKIDANTANPASTPAGVATAAQAGSTGYTGAQATATNWSVDDKQTVAGQLNGVLASNSPLLQKAQADAAQTANGRGLLNSSMAAGAGTSALLDKALQIATPDAAVNASAAQTNANTTNQVALANQGSTNTASQFTAGAKNATELANANAQTNVSATNASAANQLQQQQLQTKASIEATNTAAQNAAQQSDAALAQQANLANQDASVKTAITEYQAATQVALQNADAQTKIALQNIDATTRSSLANIEATYKVQMQSSQSASEMYKQAVQNITSLVMDKDLDATSKQAAINNQLTMLNNGFKVQQAISGLDLSGLLGGGGSTTTPSTGGGATDVDGVPGGAQTTPAPGTAPSTGIGVGTEPTTPGQKAVENQAATDLYQQYQNAVKQANTNKASGAANYAVWNKPVPPKPADWQGDVLDFVDGANQVRGRG